MSVKFTYYGGMAIQLERDNGYKILCDPYISQNPLNNIDDLRSFYNTDLLIVTHNAFDHFGDTIDIIRNSHAKIVCGWEVIYRLKEQIPDFDERRVKSTIYGDTNVIDGITIRTVNAVHGSLMNQAGITVPFLPFGYILEIERGVSYYHPGDTSLFPDFKMIREMYKPTVMAVGISRVEEQYPCEMGAREAAFAVQWVGPDVVIPTHYAKGSKDLKDFIDFIKVTAPYTIVKPNICKPFIYSPCTIEDEQ